MTVLLVITAVNLVGSPSDLSVTTGFYPSRYSCKYISNNKTVKCKVSATDLNITADIKPSPKYVPEVTAKTFSFDEIKVVNALLGRSFTKLLRNSSLVPKYKTAVPFCKYKIQHFPSNNWVDSISGYLLCDFPILCLKTIRQIAKVVFNFHIIVVTYLDEIIHTLIPVQRLIVHTSAFF